MKSVIMLQEGVDIAVYVVALGGAPMVDLGQYHWLVDIKEV